MPQRTSLLLDDEVRTAARQLAVRYKCSASEAIRRAVVRHRDAVMGVQEDHRQRRVQVLERLVTLFEGHDAEAEVRRLREETG